MFVEVLEIIGVLIGLTAILIVVWDHFKDDRLLFRQVQEFYEDIEKLIYTCILRYKEPPIENIKHKNTYYECKVEQNFERYSNYIGLTRFEEAECYYYNDSDLNLKSNGELEDNYQNSVLHYSHPHSEEVKVIDGYLKELRNYWERNYSKPLFRPKLKKKFDSSKIIDNAYWE